MKTVKLYDENAFIKSFDATVLSCEKQGGKYAVILDKTAFFPEGGGQAADEGTLGGEQVLDVKITNGEIVHFTKNPLSGEVHGELNWEKRFSRMQNHSGEHLLSGLIHKYTGADNISFSLTDTETTLAFNVPLSDELITQVEHEANEAVFKNVKISACYPSSQELEKIDYRSKLELSENVRIVTIEGVDVCACCAPHCESTGQIGLVKIVGSESYKGGTRLFINCGFRALEDYKKLLSQSKEISHLLCAKLDRLALAVERLKEEKEKTEYELVALKRKAIAEKIAQTESTEGNYICVCDFKGDDLRLFAEGLKEKVEGIILTLEGDDESGYRYVLTAKNKDISALVKKLNAALLGRGGGRDNMARGSYDAKLNEIKKFFNSV